MPVNLLAIGAVRILYRSVRVIEVVVGSRGSVPKTRGFRRPEAIIPPHQQVLHVALFNKFELPRFFSQKNNGRVIGIALMLISTLSPSYTAAMSGK